MAFEARAETVDRLLKEGVLHLRLLLDLLPRLLQELLVLLLLLLQRFVDGLLDRLLLGRGALLLDRGNLLLDDGVDVGRRRSRRGDCGRVGLPLSLAEGDSKTLDSLLLLLDGLGGRSILDLGELGLHLLLRRFDRVRDRLLRILVARRLARCGSRRCFGSGLGSSELGAKSLKGLLERRSRLLDSLSDRLVALCRELGFGSSDALLGGFGDLLFGRCSRGSRCGSGFGESGLDGRFDGGGVVGRDAGLEGLELSLELSNLGLHFALRWVR